MSSDKSQYERFIKGIEMRSFGPYSPIERQDVLEWLERAYDPHDPEPLRDLMRAVVEFLDPSRGAPSPRWLKWAARQWEEEYPKHDAHPSAATAGPTDEELRGREELEEHARMAGVDVGRPGWMMEYFKARFSGATQTSKSGYSEDFPIKTIKTTSG